MGVGGIVLLVVLAVIAMNRANTRLEDHDTTGAIVTGILFAVNVAIMIMGNPWVWAAWMLATTGKTLFLPSEETDAVKRTMPPGVFSFSVIVSVAINGLIFALFQWLR